MIHLYIYIYTLLNIQYKPVEASAYNMCAGADVTDAPTEEGHGGSVLWSMQCLTVYPAQIEPSIGRNVGLGTAMFSVHVNRFSICISIYSRQPQARQASAGESIKDPADGHVLRCGIYFMECHAVVQVVRRSCEKGAAGG